jgi:hypothetical protein
VESALVSVRSQLASANSQLMSATSNTTYYVNQLKDPSANSTIRENNTTIGNFRHGISRVRNVVTYLNASTELSYTDRNRLNLLIDYLWEHYCSG